MPWCPKCKNEYVEGMTVCADCGSELVDFLEEETKAAPEWDELAAMAAALERADREEFEGFDGEEEGAEGLTPDDPALNVYAGRRARPVASAGIYESAEKKAEEFKSGAVMLLIVGGVGLIGLALLIVGVLPISLNPQAQWMTCLVMGGLFLVFLIMGVSSMKSYKDQAKKAVEENSLREEMQRFCREELEARVLDLQAGVAESDSEEFRYFKRADQLKRSLNERFLELEEAYLDEFVDEIYPQIFGEG